MTMAAKGLAKLIEECGELQQIAGKRLAYYTTDVHPDGAGSLQQRMTDEMGDVIAAIQFCASKFGIDYGAVMCRAVEKLRRFERWDADESNNGNAIDAEHKERS